MNKKIYVDLSQQDVQDIINAYEKDIEKFNKQKEVIDKIKEKLNKTNNLALNETGYKEYLKSNFIKDKDIFKTICHLEDFELIYGEIKELLEEIE